MDTNGRMTQAEDLLSLAEVTQDLNERHGPRARAWHPGQSTAPTLAESWRRLRALALSDGGFANLEFELDKIIKRHERRHFVFRPAGRVWLIGSRELPRSWRPEHIQQYLKTLKAAHRAIDGEPVRWRGRWPTDSAFRSARDRLAYWVRDVAELPPLAEALREGLKARGEFVVYDPPEFLIEIETRVSRAFRPDGGA